MSNSFCSLHVRSEPGNRNNASTNYALVNCSNNFGTAGFDQFALFCSFLSYPGSSGNDDRHDIFDPTSPSSYLYIFFLVGATLLDASALGIPGEISPEISALVTSRARPPPYSYLKTRLRLPPVGVEVERKGQWSGSGAQSRST